METGAKLNRKVALARDLAARGQSLVRLWPVVEIAQFYEQLDQLANSPTPGGGSQADSAIGDAALELLVYLSALVESGSEANAAQRDRTQHLLQQLAAAAGAELGVASAEAPTRRSSDHRVVYFLRADDRDVPGLIAQLGRERFVTRSYSDLNRALADARHLPPHALIVDEGFVSGLARMIETVERAAGPERRRPLVLALSDGTDVRRRLSALRAGANEVLEGVDALRISERLLSLFLRQSREDARVLIIDDDESIARFCANVLGLRGITTKIAPTARDGLAELVRFRPDLVLLDLYLPDMNGIEVAQLIRERPDMSLLPIVFMSGEEDLDKRFDAIRMGGDDFLAKPLKPRHLLASVTSRVGRARLISRQSSGNEAVRDPGAGRIERATLVHEIERARRGEHGDNVALLMWSVDDVRALARRLGFLRTGDLGQQIGTVLAGESALRSGVCPLGEFSFLALMSGSSEGALRVAAENLRARLSARSWLSVDAPVQVSFSLGAVRVDVRGLGVDLALSQVADALSLAQENGGARSEWVASAEAQAIPPEQRIAETLLRRPLQAETTSFRFRPAIPLHGQLSGQTLCELWLQAPRTKVASRIGPEVYLPVARALDVMRSVDRWQIHALARLARERQAEQLDLRLFVAVSTEVLVDSTFPQWLAADLFGLHCEPDVLALMIDARSVREDLARHARALELAQTAGVKLCLYGFDQFDRDQQRLCRLPSTYANVIDFEGPSAGWPEARARLIAESLRHGKIVIVRGLSDPGPLGDLYRDGVHYVIGDAVGPWGSDLPKPAPRSA